ncbi:unnamed protein product [Arctia plantaginis]|uniref:Uncharacterized protein n=1 Tax=Arctia plantaginis TaxID=874455 RepID=A0A8S1AQ82_ARCPL|nr:unnamed protein product [Arctia plantaginis]CAB3249477.1 unnamed protein product [Arctia plantaginis]
MYYRGLGECDLVCNRWWNRRGLISRPRRVGMCSAWCAPRACVRPALGAHCSISEAGTATPPDWAIHHRRRPLRHPPALRTPAANTAPCAQGSKVSFPARGSRRVNAATRAAQIEAYF